MSDIRIARPHTLPLSRVRGAAQAAADELAQKYGIEARWEGGVLRFRRSGMHGHIEISPTQIGMEIHLGILFKGFRRAIEQQVAAKLDDFLRTASSTTKNEPVPPHPDPV